MNHSNHSYNQDKPPNQFVQSIGKKRLHVSNVLAEIIIRLIGFLSILIILSIFVFVFREAFPIFSQKSKGTTQTSELLQSETYGEEPSKDTIQVSPKTSLETSGHEGTADLKNLLGKEWQPVSEHPKYGLLPLVAGSFKVTLIALLIAGPIGVLSALYTSAFSPKWAKELLKPTIEILAGFPSVVIGFFALVVLATFMQETFGFHYRLNAFVGGIALSLAVIPIIYTITEDSLTAVPYSLWEASFALGASKWQTVLFVVLPAALPGVLASLILGFGRAFGETMIVLMATGNAALLSFNPLEPVRTMSATIGAEMAEVVFGETHYTVLFLIGSILFLFTFTLNAIVEFYIRQKLMRKFLGKA
ncbi:MAG: phosphate ABC transporter permease subunit PstC [bacterium]|nr:phosphate ABC transporter permease subunit PstC [bacterium]